MRIAIVTPVLHGARFLDEAILSVVTQAGDFAIRYHVQDGGSTDGTLDKLARWKARLAADFPILCRSIDFSYSSAADRGMYDGINRGFAVCGDSDAMTWINADDRLEPRALQSVAQILERNPGIDWLCGRATLIDHTGAMIHCFPVTPFPRKAIAAGIFDSRFAPPFVQQEGGFWRPRLWHAAGGLNSAFRLAGDFDLWRRFAQHADLVVADAIFGCWRMVSGQMSENKAPYHNEIDGSMGPGDKRIRAETARQYTEAASHGTLRENGFAYRVVTRPAYGDWVCEDLPKLAIASDSPHRPPRSLLQSAWSARRLLPASLSLRRLISRVSP
jgi:glycosyltransferase involved in cell wall biosynthesis